MKTQHTPEPWTQKTHHEPCVNPSTWTMGSMLMMPPQDYQRAMACVNACKGINPDAVPDMLKALQAIAAGMGNLPLEEHGQCHGINDGRSKAIYLERFVGLARAAITKAIN